MKFELLYQSILVAVLILNKLILVSGTRGILRRVQTDKSNAIDSHIMDGRKNPKNISSSSPSTVSRSSFKKVRFAESPRQSLRKHKVAFDDEETELT